MGRFVVLLLSLIFIGGLAFLTVRVVVEDGFTIVVAAAALILAILVFGVLGALTGRQR